MSDDPRFVEWLDVTQSALGAPSDESLRALDRAKTARAELQSSLEADPPSQTPSAQLSEQLARAEEALVAATEQLRETVRTAIEELRQVRTATDGYKPTRPNRPAFVSKSV
jgi:hypothetical protein